MRHLLLILCLLAAALTSANAAETRRYFDDWLGACRDDGYCSAIAYVNPNPGDGRVADYWFRIGRHAQETYWELSFTPILVMADPAAPMTLAVDDKPEPFTPPAEVAAYGSINDFFFLGGGAQAVMDRMMPGRRLDVRFTDDTGAPRLATFSLNGLTAALIWIDEAQGRLGSERVAEAPPTDLEPVAPPVEEEPFIPAIDPATVELVNLHNSSNCSVRLDGETALRVGRFDPDGDHTAYTVPCEDFAYNFISRVYVYVDGVMTTAALPQSDADESDASQVFSPAWDPATAELRSFYKGGNGNCGNTGRWRWTGDGFELVELRARETCDQSDEEWPVVATGG